MSVQVDTTQWRISDDTQLTLATCEALVEAGRPDPEAIASAFLRWFNQRRITGMGASTLKALRELQAGNHWALAGNRGEMSAGNGAAMRIAPLAFFLDPAKEDDRKTIRDVCRITHHNDEAYAGALAIVAAVRAAFRASWDGGPALLQFVAERLPDTRVRDVLKDMARLEQDTTIAAAAGRFGHSGYVAESVPLALFGAQYVTRLGFEDTLMQLVAIGGDTDTIAAIAGHVMGAWLGFQALPIHYVQAVPERKTIESLGRALAGLMATR